MNDFRIVAVYKTHSFPLPQNIVYFYGVDGYKDGFYVSHGPFQEQNPTLFEFTYISRTKSVVLDHLRGIMASSGSWLRVPAVQRGRGQFIAREFGLTNASDLCINTGISCHVEEGGLYTLDPLSRAVLGIEKVKV